MKQGEFPATQGRLGHYEAVAMLTIMMTSRIFLGLPRLMAIIGGTASWLVVTLAAMGALLGYLVLDALLARFPGLDLIQISRRLIGWLTPLFGLLFFLFFLAVTALVTRQFAETFVVGILPRTPIGVIGGLLLVLLVLASYLGLETISRLAILYAPYLLLFLLLVYALVLPNASLLNLAPVWGKGLPKIILPSLGKSSVYADLVLLGFFAPSLREPSRRRAVGLSALGATFLIFILTAVVFTLVFDYPGTTQVYFPLFQLARLVSIGEFFQRVEAVFIFLWFFAAVIAMSAAFYACAYIFCRVFSLTTHRPLLFPLAVLVYSLSLLPDSFAEAARLDGDVLRMYGWLPAFLLPAFLFGVAIIRRRKGTEQR